ncbi:hypothetical protein J19TS2_60690 [Cohnella xylanilytica]|uniref:hypothetical protein n=1 Tax=Cohnella xylanilytica TaxID=557555 RepID=UPI001B19C4EC|nr:hypothetical protein [Cohnella xylanilytica]GIO16514.1 hypothetical protein J19TS2_60690 [Cohnella xylanilytica]
MEKEQIEYTVEYLDRNGVVYFENVKASGLPDAKLQIRQKFPDVMSQLGQLPLFRTIKSMNKPSYET